MIKIFLNGGPVMWPLLICSIITVATALERLFFVIRERARRKPQLVEKILERVERHDLDGAIKIGSDNRDFVARVLTFALAHRAESFSSEVLRAANLELKKFNRGLAVLDTIVTLAPLLGLLGTVTGMIHAFGLLGGHELDAPEAITGGISQALIATAFGLSIAITALIPFNYLNARLEEARHDIEDAATQLELHLEQFKECKHEGESK
jgi:biopolymer transport protein ExbB